MVGADFTGIYKLWAFKLVVLFWPMQQILYHHLTKTAKHVENKKDIYL